MAAVSLVVLLRWDLEARAGDQGLTAVGASDNAGTAAIAEPVHAVDGTEEGSSQALTANSAGPGTNAGENRDPTAPAEGVSDATADPVATYLFDVYRRSPTKRDGHGDFTWKDQAAAELVGMSLKEYVISGMDPDFRELLYSAGLAMDRAGISWTILSGFRDDYRQGIAVGLKAHGGNSLHGGTVATGGYGHGCAVDLGSVDGLSNQEVWQWVAVHGAGFGLRRPLAERDPAHVQPRGAWHELAAAFRRHRTGADGETAVGPEENTGATDSTWMPAGDFSLSLGDPCTNRQALVDHMRGVGTANEPPKDPATGEPPRAAGSLKVLSEAGKKPKMQGDSRRLHTMWFVQLSGGPSESVALGGYYRVQRKFGRILGAYRPVLAAAGGQWYRARIALGSRAVANKLCTNLRSAGGDCIVLPN